MPRTAYRRLPRHIGIIPDGNRRWAAERGWDKADGYAAGVGPGLQMIADCQDLGIEHATVYGFTSDNTRRPRAQRQAFSQACIDFASAMAGSSCRFRVLGKSDSSCFPVELQPYCQRTTGTGMAITMLANYSWEWDLTAALDSRQGGIGPNARTFTDQLASAELPRLDLIIRWGGCRRLSGFLPVQSVYADFFVIDTLWPEARTADLHRALEWYQRQDQTLGG